MDFCFKKNIYPTALFLVVFFYGCHSLPPSTPAGPEEQYFEPGVGLWEKTSMPADLLGDWYKGGKLELTVGEDTLRVSGIWSLIQSVEKSDSYYRIIHAIGAQYYATYFINLTEESVEVVETRSYAADEEGAAGLSEIESRHTMTSTNPWVTTGMPGDLQGNWHIHDGNMEMVIDRESLVLDGELWGIDSVQTNRTVDRLILKSGNRYKSLYFGEVGEYTMDVLLVDGKADIQDRYGKVNGNWVTLHKWWDFIEQCRLYPGSRWIYEYSYQEYYTQVYNTTTPIDSIVQTNSLTGQFELEVTSSTIQEGTGSLTLYAAFQIDGGEGWYFHARKDGKTEVLTDSSWVNPGHLKTEQYEIVLEDDTLWYATEEGVVFFASAKIESFAAINLRAFVYPFEFPREGFPEGRDILGEILFHDEIIPSRPKVYGDTPSAIIHHSDDSITYLAGSYINNYLCLLSGGGFRDMNYFFGDYDQLYWNGREWYLDPYVKETSFSCKLLSFTPGH
jgi:hypothetical protein